MVIKTLLQEHGLPGESGTLEAQMLLAHVLDKPRSYLYAWSDASITTEQEQRYFHFLAQRQAGAPVAYLLGRREFWSLDLEVNEHTLIPRPETEALVEYTLSLALEQGSSVLDMGTGTGAIALALAKERPDLKITATDVSAGALEVAIRNAQRLALDVEFLASSWFEQLAGRQFDLVVSNPPYIAADDAHLQQGDLRFEPQSALASGRDGLDDLRKIVAAAPNYLKPDGSLLLEHGFDQGGAVAALMNNFDAVVTHTDLAGLPRFTAGTNRALITNCGRALGDE